MKTPIKTLMRLSILPLPLFLLLALLFFPPLALPHLRLFFFFSFHSSPVFFMPIFLSASYSSPTIILSIYPSKSGSDPAFFLFVSLFVSHFGPTSFLIFFFLASNSGSSVSYFSLAFFHAPSRSLFLISSTFIRHTFSLIVSCNSFICR